MCNYLFRSPQIAKSIFKKTNKQKSMNACELELFLHKLYAFYGSCFWLSYYKSTTNVKEIKNEENIGAKSPGKACILNYRTGTDFFWDQ